MLEITNTAREGEQQSPLREISHGRRAGGGSGERQHAKVPAHHGLVLLLVVAGLWLMTTSVAWAGEWSQVTCTQPNSQPAPIEGWQGSSIGGYGADSGPSDTCSQPGGSLTATDSSAETESAYTGPMWVYTAPAGSTIAGGTMSVSLTTPQGEAYVATPQNSYDQADVLINCQFNLPCGSNGTETRTVAITHTGGTQLFAAALCVGPTYGATTCPAGSGGGLNAQLILYSADIELANGSTPAGSGFGGPLLQPGASGTEDLTFNAQDPGGPGVYRVIVGVDNASVYQGTPDANGGRCASIGTDSSGLSEFLYAQPCKQNLAVDLPVDTTKLTNGQHQLKITVQDAASNTSVVYDGTISVNNPNAKANSGDITGSSQTFSRGPANGTNASDKATLTAHWTSTPKANLTSGYDHPLKVTGRLMDPGGTPIEGALIDLTATPAYAGAKPITMTRPRTARNGRFSVSLSGGLSSRTLRFAYRSHLDDTLPAATRTLTLNVRAAITLRIAPHVASVGRKIFFNGVLHGGPIPPAGKQLVLEARSPRTPWLEFDVIRTDSRGRFHSFYRFRLPGPHHYHFRIISKYESDFAFVAGASNTVQVEEQ
jgi:hypothetical protein